MIGPAWKSWLIPCLGLLLLAGGLRFYRLGDWSLAGDETATFEEVDSLLTHPPTVLKDQIDSLPRLIPLAHGTLFVGYQLFGRSDFGCRVLPALLGAMNVALLYLLLRGPLGEMPALASALFFALWPEHIFHSQENRFYIPAEFISSLCMASGALAAQRRSLGWMAIACLSAFLAILFHTTLGLLQIGLVISFTVANIWDHRPGAWFLLGLILVTSIGSRFLFTGYLMPIYRSWNFGSGWGYGPIQAVLASVVQLGLPVVLLAMLGAIFAIHERSPQGYYWVVWAGLWATVCLFLPRMMIYQPSYAFAFAPPVCVLAGLAVARIYEALKPVAPVAAVAWFGLVFLLNAPSVLSHYVDGSRHDFRSAAWYVADHFREGDRIAAISPALLSYYTPICHDAIPLTSWHPQPDLEAAAAKPGRLWIVLGSSRSGKGQELTRWLSEHARLRAQFRKTRLDYYEYSVEVYLRPASTGNDSSR
jgi:hypothetical protein